MAANLEFIKLRGEKKGIWVMSRTANTWWVNVPSCRENMRIQVMDMGRSQARQSTFPHVCHEAALD